MPKRTDIQTILIIGSGPIVIGQACEFDYSGTQALKALAKEGYRIVLVNSNPATIMTDPELAYATYVEPLTLEILEEVIAKERPQALLPTLGGQTALNLAVALAEKGILDKYKVELIGAKLPAIKKAEDRKLFKKTMQEVGLRVPKSGYAKSIAEGEEVARSIGFPLIIRPSFTLGGIGSGTVYTKDELLEALRRGLEASPVNEVLMEESVIGWKEFELEVMRDVADNCVVICSIENLDPMGVHTGDSITVAPIQTLTDREYQAMRDDAFTCIRAIGVDTGGSNIQFAVNPQTGERVVIEMNPRVSRSSALASKATGFPIAKIAALLAVGYRLDELPNDITKKTPASFEPAIDYIVVKVPRFAFEKFTAADQTLNTAMKSVGEVMALGRTFKEALQKALRGLEIGSQGLGADTKSPGEGLGTLEAASETERERLLNLLKDRLRVPNCDRIFYIRVALKAGIQAREIVEWSKIDPWFISQIEEIVAMEQQILAAPSNPLEKDLLLEAKRHGFSDFQLAKLRGVTEKEVNQWRHQAGVLPTYKSVDTCAAEFKAYTPYFYSTYEEEDETAPTARKKVMILGGGPNRIGQGIEFDYCCVHAVMALKEEGYETIMVNCNPETVSTDYDTSDKLYFEPLTLEDVLNIVEKEKPEGLIVQFGGQTPLNLAIPLERAKVPILGTSPDSIDLAEDRQRFGALLTKLGIPQAPNGTARSFEEARACATHIGYPVMVRPSYVLGGRAMEVVYDESMLADYIERATRVSPEHPILIDKFLDNATELDVDVLCDGEDTYIGGIMEHIEEAGIHSGDSACVLPSRTLSAKDLATLRQYTEQLAKGLQVKGLMNIQFAIREGIIYILEANPRASRTVPFVSKATGVPLAKLAARVMVGRKLKDLLPAKLLKEGPQMKWVAVKEAVLPWMRFPGVDAILGPEMRSTGEVMGIDQDFNRAFAKSQSAAGSELPKSGGVLISVTDRDKPAMCHIARELKKLGFELYATESTAAYFRQQNLEVRHVLKLTEGRPNVADVIKNRDVSLVINTPSGKRTRSEGFTIRQAALQHNVPIVTTLAAARAALSGIRAIRDGHWTVSPLQTYYASARAEEKASNAAPVKPKV
ncbi:MAG: carbamoyl-phosphate synthase large subunit [Elusimicrobiota bacterium]|jgi:carbamoyl-phosphate synthase large subunit